MKTILKVMSVAVATFALTANAEAAKYKEGSVDNGGSVSGHVAIGGAQPLVKTFTITKDPQACGDGSREVSEVRANNGALLDAVVYIDKIKKGKPFPAGLNKVTINQEKCAFKPFLSVMKNKGELEAINSDATLHNIHTYEFMDAMNKKRRTVLNVSQPEKGNIVTKKIKMRRGVGMKVECDAHDFMHAYVFVASNPYFSVVDDNGNFEIKDIPPGKYAIKVWHGFLGTREGTVEIAAGGAAKVDFSY